MENQELPYTITKQDGNHDYLYAKTMWGAYQEALALYGEGISVRPSFYGEWDCGVARPEEVSSRTRCYYDIYGKHHYVNKVSA